MIKKYFWILLFVFRAAIAAAEPVHVQTHLFCESSVLAAGATSWLMVEMTHDSHWHSYWINPGDSGLATTFKWTLPEGIRVGDPLWPAPERIASGPLVSYGYTDTIFVLFPLSVGSDFAQSKIALQVKVDWLECREICLPAKAELALDIPVASAVRKNPQVQERFAAAQNAIPQRFSNSLRAVNHGNNLELKFSVTEPDAKDVYFFSAQEGWLKNLGQQSWQQEASQIQLTIPVEDSAVAPQNLDGVLVVKTASEKKSYAVRSVLSAEPSAAQAEGSAPQLVLWLALLFAFLGGMILNLMPCVLPVLSIKVLGLLHHASESKEKARGYSLLYALGILVSFWVLLAVILIFKAAGSNLGWGFQLQSPEFVLGLAFLFLTMALNLLGLFEIGTSFIQAGSKLGARSAGVQSFLSGVLATIVATPCTAPFMGSAIGFALTQSVWISFATFTALALGLAFPYVLLVHLPALLRYLPKPGAWMEILKSTMGFLLLLSVVWLLWVLGRQTNIDILAMQLCALIIFSMGLWLYGRSSKKLAVGIALILLLGSLGFAWRTLRSSNQSDASVIAWQTFSPAAVEEARQSGRNIFIDFTAAWCLTCQVNERVALRDPNVVARFKELNISAFKADWTSRDETITQALKSFGRSGVPLYVYEAQGQDPQILPEIITPEIVLSKIKK